MQFESRNRIWLALFISLGGLAAVAVGPVLIFVYFKFTSDIQARSRDLCRSEVQDKSVSLRKALSQLSDPRSISDIFQNSNVCKLQLFTSQGKPLRGSFSESLSQQFLVEYQSEISLQNFYVAHPIEKLILAGYPDLSPPFLQDFKNYISFHFFLALAFFLFFAAYIFLEFREHLFRFREAVNQLSEGFFPSVPLKTENAFFSEIFDDLTQLSHVQKARLPILQKNVQLRYLNNLDTLKRLKEEDPSSADVLILVLEVPAFDKTVWAAIFEIVRRSGAIFQASSPHNLELFWSFRPDQGLPAILKELISAIHGQAFGLQCKAVFAWGQLDFLSYGHPEFECYGALGDALNQAYRALAQSNESLIVLDSAVQKLSEGFKLSPQGNFFSIQPKDGGRFPK